MGNYLVHFNGNIKTAAFVGDALYYCFIITDDITWYGGNRKEAFGKTDLRVGKKTVKERRFSAGKSSANRAKAFAVQGGAIGNAPHFIFNMPQFLEL